MGADQSTNKFSGPNPSDISAASTLPSYSLSTIQKHKSAQDGYWMILHDLVYDVTPFIPSHPGGENLLITWSGTDATQKFEAMGHSKEARERASELLIGRVNYNDKEEEEDGKGKVSSSSSTSPSPSTASHVPSSSPSSSSSVPSDTNSSSSVPSSTETVPHSLPLLFSSSSSSSPSSATPASPPVLQRVSIVYASLFGSTERLATRLFTSLNKSFPSSSFPLSISLIEAKSFEPETLNKENYVIFLFPTHADGAPPTSASFLYQWLMDSTTDFRIDGEWLSNVKVAVWGSGSTDYDNDHYNVIAKNIQNVMDTMGAQSLCSLGLGDDSISRNDNYTLEDDFAKWEKSLMEGMRTSIYNPAEFERKVDKYKILLAAKKAKAKGKAKAKTQTVGTILPPASSYLPNHGMPMGLPPIVSNDMEGEDEDDDDEDDDEDDEEEEKKGSGGEPLVDVEELGDQLKSSTKSKDKVKGKKKSKKSTEESKESSPPVVRAMITDKLRDNLTREGYKLIGSHSGVKLCRWTKAHLRGRGGCYKHTFYGINSFQCMEMTPSLACANKCTFCIAEGTLISCADGFSRKIETLSGKQNILTAWTREEDREKGTGVGQSILLTANGLRECIELSFEDGRTLICTPDHQIFTLEKKWIEAKDIVLNEDNVCCGPDYAEDNTSNNNNINNNNNNPIPSNRNRVTLYGLSLILKERRTYPFSHVKLIGKKSVGLRKVYDLSVPTHHSFIANGIVVHNCWRHQTNPVGREWKWQLDSPEYIIEHAMNYHKKMVYELKGVPGVKAERFAEAQTIRHCALSLVGEPIFYPHINTFVRLLHSNGISTFLVTNAQFPDRIIQMEPVTQLYVSVDAATRETLKAIDRPLFTDFWQRFQDSLSSVKFKRQRTVYRLTVVKGWNMNDIAEYAKLVSLGSPTFIEIKGVTFVGSTASATGLTIGNSPYHEEVKAFGESLVSYLNGEYAVACEHQHSCCILISHIRMKNEETGRWKTWIDYPKFLTLVNKYYQSEGKETFRDLDYSVDTPQWAEWDAPERGFNPTDQRVNEKKRAPKMDISNRPKTKGLMEVNGKMKIVEMDGDLLATNSAATAEEKEKESESVSVSMEQKEEERVKESD